MFLGSFMAEKLMLGHGVFRTSSDWCVAMIALEELVLAFSWSIFILDSPRSKPTKEKIWCLFCTRRFVHTKTYAGFREPTVKYFALVLFLLFFEICLLVFGVSRNPLRIQLPFLTFGTTMTPIWMFSIWCFIQNSNFLP